MSARASNMMILISKESKDLKYYGKPESVVLAASQNL